MARSVNNNSRHSEILKDDFLRDICLGKYVLVLGEDVILKQEHAKGNSKDYIDECFRDFLNDDDNIERKDDFENGDISKKELVREMLWEFEYDKDVISESLGKLLRTRFFPIVLTTSFDGYVETLMRDIYGDDLKVCNFFENKVGIEKSKEYGTFSPTLYYVFGKAEGNLDFAYNEDDYMKTLCKWMDSNDRPQKLIDYLRTKKILAIGGKYENWYFRFVWYSLRQSLDRSHRLGDVAISLNNDGDRVLLNYLKRIRVKNHPENAQEFLAWLSDKLYNLDLDLLVSIHTIKRQINGVFISYAQEDYSIACQIYSVLYDFGVPVWFDNEKLKMGDDYRIRIERAISECKIFMPILSSQIKVDCINNNWRYYKDEEWRMVANNKNCKIAPIALYGFDKRKDTHLLPSGFQNVSIIDWSDEGEAKLKLIIDMISK